VAVNQTFDVNLSRQARCALTTTLPESVAAACYEFLRGPLAGNPRRVGKQLVAPLHPAWSARRGEYRVIYRIESDAVYVLSTGATLTAREQQSQQPADMPAQALSA
jgi:mRNA interferase RelE/StbE